LKHPVANEKGIKYKYDELQNALENKDSKQTSLTLESRKGKKDHVQGYIVVIVKYFIDELPELINKQKALDSAMKDYDAKQAEEAQKRKEEEIRAAEEKKKAEALAFQKTSDEVVAQVDALKEGKAPFETFDLHKLVPASLTFDQKEGVVVRILNSLVTVAQSQLGKSEFENPTSVFVKGLVVWVFQQKDVPRALVAELYKWGNLASVEDNFSDSLLFSFPKLPRESQVLPEVAAFKAANPVSRAAKKFSGDFVKKYKKGSFKMPQWDSSEVDSLTRELKSIGSIVNNPSDVTDELVESIRFFFTVVFNIEHFARTHFFSSDFDKSLFNNSVDRFWDDMARFVSDLMEKATTPVYKRIMGNSEGMLIGDGINEHRRNLHQFDAFYVDLKDTFRGAWNFAGQSSTSLLRK
jgi:hypothetical protein